VVPGWDGYAIGENPLSMDGIFLGGMNYQQGKKVGSKKLND
jgi:hypothetical protein